MPHPRPPRPVVRSPVGSSLARLAAAASAIFVLAPPLACTRARDPAEPPASAAGSLPLREVWQRAWLAGRPSGYVHSAEYPRRGGGITSRTEMQLTVRRGSVPLAMRVSEEVEEDAEGRVVAFGFEQEVARDFLRVRGRVEGGRLRITSRSGDSPPRESEAPFDERAIGPHRAWLRQKELLRREGDEIEDVVIASEIQRCATQTTTLGPLEEIEISGEKRRLRRVVTRLDYIPTAPISTWVDEELEPVKTRISLMGMELVTERTTREVALARSDWRPPEIFYSTSVPIDRAVPASARRAVYRLAPRRAEGSFSVRFPVASGQRLLEEEGAARVVEVRSVAPEPGAACARPADPEAAAELEGCSSPSTFISSDDPRIARAARQIAAGRDDPVAVARDLERWVRDHVRAKNLETGFATATEVFERREGDCTEHAVLLAALARAAGIPARVVAGLLASDGAMVGHMWTEVWCGEWFGLDGTLGRGRVGADHLALSASALATDSAGDLFLSLASVLGEVRISVLEVE